MLNAFRNRQEAGRALAKAVSALLARQVEMDDPVVLALPRGGVPVALEVAREIRAPLDLVMVRKIGVPWRPELAAAAVVDGDQPQLFINEDVVKAARLTMADINAGMRRQLAEIERRRALYLGGRERVDIAGRDAIVVDDGVATGATTRAALRAVRLRRPRSVTLAVPVAAGDTASVLEKEVDHHVCLLTPDPFLAIGYHYGNFDQVPDEEVVRMLGQRTD